MYETAGVSKINEARRALWILRVRTYLLRVQLLQPLNQQFKNLPRSLVFGFDHSRDPENSVQEEEGEPGETDSHIHVRCTKQKNSEACNN